MEGIYTILSFYLNSTSGSVLSVPVILVLATLLTVHYCSSLQVAVLFIILAILFAYLFANRSQDLCKFSSEMKITTSQKKSFTIPYFALPFSFLQDRLLCGPCLVYAIMKVYLSFTVHYKYVTCICSFLKSIYNLLLLADLQLK